MSETTAFTNGTTNVARAAAAEALWLRLLRRWGTISVIVLTAIGFGFASPWFLTLSNLNNILFSMIVSALVAMGLTFVVMAGSFDLSVGLAVTFTSIVTAFGVPVLGPWGAIVAALMAAALIGLVNGLLVTYGRLSGIVVTLAMMFVLEGMNTFLTGGYQVPVSYSEVAFAFIGQGKIAPLVSLSCSSPWSLASPTCSQLRPRLAITFPPSAIIRWRRSTRALTCTTG